MTTVETEPLSSQDIEMILRQPNGPFVLLELVRMGRVDSETAVTAIDESRRTPLWKRLGYALLNTFFSR